MTGRWAEFVEAHKGVVPQIIRHYPEPAPQVFFEEATGGITTVLIADMRPEDPQAIEFVQEAFREAQARRFLYMIPVWHASMDVPGAGEMAERHMLNKLPETTSAIILAGVDHEQGRIAFIAEHDGTSLGPWKPVAAQMRVLDALEPMIVGGD